MNLYIDTEFNGFGGELISMAIVSECGKEFYEVLPCAAPIGWVAENVMPVLGKEPTSLKWLQINLQRWLHQFPTIHVIADWPEDIQHFCKALITGPGMSLNTPPLTMEIRCDVNAVSEIPHNALADARGIRDMAVSLKASG